jgi:type I restriction enzyme, R subunit
MVDISERSLEATIEKALLGGGPDDVEEQPGLVRERPVEYGEPWPASIGGYRRRTPEEYDRDLCLIGRDLLDFVMATQPKQWQRLQEHHGAEVKDRFLKRIAGEVAKRGTLDVLRNGVKDSGCRFDVAYFRPSSGLNPDVQRLYEANVFSAVRQLRYSTRNGNSLDLVLFLNGLPLFTAELKNQFTGQDIDHAKRQYMTDRDPREPLFAFGRCLAHFAVDPDVAAVTTKLDGQGTVFLPFNQGRFGGAGNPPVPPTRIAYATAYLWERIWARDSVLNLVQQFVHEIEEEDEKGRKTGKRSLIFPRYHQLDCVRRLVAHARDHGAGERYLIQHSAGSGKSNSIAWLAHQLSILHDTQNRRVFDSIVIVTDRKVLDRQLQRTVRQFEQTSGIVENIDRTSRQLKDALESGKTIIVTTLQKFPVIAEKMGELAGTRFALIIDEAHSSQSGESTKKLKAVLAAPTLEEAQREEQEPEDDLEDRIVAEMRKRGHQKNVSTFAFTATPKSKTLELFGVKTGDGTYEPFSLYSMRQAIEEKFILDVLQNYTTYKVYWNLLKKVQDDPHYDRAKASYLLQSFVGLHDHAIRKKVEVMIEHFHQQVASRINGRAKAMVVTRSRLHAVRFKLDFEKYLRERRYPYKALVAFSGEVRDGGVVHTESNMNDGLSEAQTAKTFERPEFRFLIVANKFQTGFDQPLLHTMYVDKKLGGVQAVQTLSRLNRTAPRKTDTMVLDFANEAGEIEKAFQPYFERTILSEGTDPNLLYDLHRALGSADAFTATDVEAFAKLYFNARTVQEQLYAAVRPLRDRFTALPPDEQTLFRSRVNDYIRLYAFLSQVLTFTDSDLEKLYVFLRALRHELPRPEGGLPTDVQEAIDMASYRLEQKTSGQIALQRGAVPLEPLTGGAVFGSQPERIEPLSEIIRELNEKFGTDFREKDKVVIRQLEERLSSHESLADSIRVNTRENAMLTFESVVTDQLQDLANTNFEFYKRVTDDDAFARHFLNWLFERVRQNIKP